MCYKHILEFKQHVLKSKYLNFDEIIKKKKIIVKRDFQNQIIPAIYHKKKVDNYEIYIRHGQLTEQKLIDGVGRKITLKPFNYIGDTIVDYVADETFIEEGEFFNDQLDGTFGRRLYMNGNYKFGWF